MLLVGDILIGLWYFLFGAAAGSFINVVSDRLPENKSILGRSKCDHCRKTIAWHDLIPVISFFFLKGRCRYCRKRLSWKYPVTEILSGTVFWLFASRGGFYPSTGLFFLLVIVGALLTIAMADFKYTIILDEVLVIIIAMGLLMNYDRLFVHLTGSMIAAFLFWLLHYFSRGKAMGFGDVKYVFAMGLILPPVALGLGVYLAFLTGGVVSVILLLARRKGLKSKIAFGPFLTAGFLIILWVLM